MPSGKSGANRPATGLTSAAQRTRSAIEDLQAKLVVVSQQAGTANLPARDPSVRGLESAESEGDLELQLASYFARSYSASLASLYRPAIEAMRKNVIDEIVDRILDDWSRVGGSSALREQVLERLIQRVLQQMGNAREPSLNP